MRLQQSRVVATIGELLEARTYWVVAFIIGFESLVAGIQGLLDRRLDHAILWTTAALVLFLAGILSERHKTSEGGYP